MARPSAEGFQPLARKPKRLQERPSVVVLGPDGGGLVSPLETDEGPVGRRTLFTGDRGVSDPVDVAPPSSSAARELAADIAKRLALPTWWLDVPPEWGHGDPARRRFRGNADEIDLEATIEAGLDRQHCADEDIIVRERRVERRSVVVAVDVSGSMKDDRILTAAATVGALASVLRDHRLAVIAFWSDAAVLLELGQPVDIGQLVDAVTCVPARGLTNVAFPLDLAFLQLEGVPDGLGRVVLLSDCVHNAGPDPRDVAAARHRVDVLLDTSDHHDAQLGADIARIGRGELHHVPDHRAVAGALNSILRG